MTDEELEDRMTLPLWDKIHSEVSFDPGSSKDYGEWLERRPVANGWLYRSLRWRDQLRHGRTETMSTTFVPWKIGQVDPDEQLASNDLLMNCDKEDLGDCAAMAGIHPEGKP